MATDTETTQPMEFEVHSTTETGAPAQLRPFVELAPLAPRSTTETEGTAITTTPAPASKALVSGPVAAVLAVLATVGGFAAGILPAPYSLAVGVLALALAAIAGVGIKVPAITQGKPLVSAALVVPCIALAGILAQLVPTLPDGPVRGLAAAGAVLLFGLAGVPVPAQLRTPPAS